MGNGGSMSEPAKLHCWRERADQPAEIQWGNGE
jgi:hypothetical protein